MPTAAKTTPVNPAPKPHPAKHNLLDLTKDQPSAGAAHRPAQSIHGVRRPAVPTKAVETSSTSSLAGYTDKLAGRHQRAAAISRHPKIGKFKTVHDTPPGVHKKHDQHTRTHKGRAMSPHHTYAVSAEHSSVPNQEPEHAASTVPDVYGPASRKHPFKRFSRALSSRPRLVASVAVTLTVLVLAGYVTYLNVPSLAVKVAAARAGIDGQLPRYRPAGYEFSGPVAYSSGQIVIRLDSKNENSFLTLTQRQTDWDPATLVENYVLKKSKNYLTFQENGLTIYVYNGNNAAWINNGVLYAIEGNTQLPSVQILHMATSL